MRRKKLRSGPGQRAAAQPASTSEQAETAYAPLCGRLERNRAKGAHGRRKGGATIGLRGRACTSCPARCHAVIRARQQISKERGLLIAKHGAVLGMVKTKPPAAVVSGQS